MGGISSGTGLFSGIDSSSLINQLLAIEARPKQLAQQRVLQLRQQQAAYLDLNSKIQALKTAAASFRTGNIFQSAKATSSDEDVLTGTASKNAIPGSYSFVVDRLVSTQQFISRGFADASTSGVNAGSFTFEPAAGRLDRETSLADLNGGNGVARGKIIISDSAGHSTTVDLSKAATANDVLDAINSSGAGVTASIDGGKFVVTSNTPATTITIASGFGYTTAASLGIESSTPAATITGSQVYSLGRSTSLRSLNDGNGVFMSPSAGQGRFDFTIRVTDGSGTTSVNVNIGDVYDTPTHVASAAVTTVGGVLDRINQALTAQFNNSDITASLAPDGQSIRIVDATGRSLEVAENASSTGTAARDLGLLTTAPQTGTVAGARILASMNSTLARSLNGGQGVSGDGQISITARDGTVAAFSVSTGDSVEGILRAINQGTAGKVTAALNRTGTGIILTDHTGGGQNLIVAGATATSLGIATDVAGVASSTVNSGSLQHQYLTSGTLLSSLRTGQGVGTGTFRITDSTGASQTLTVTESTKSVDDLIKLINNRGLRVKARINDKGDGILLYEDAAGAGAAKIKVEDTAGGVAAALGLAGTAAGTGVQNVLDGSQEKTITFAAGDTLQTVATKISAANVGVAAAVISDGAGSTPYRLSLTAKNSGSAGRFTVDTGSFDLGATQLDAGQDARVFFGSGDPARAVLLSSSRNTMDQVVPGVTIDLNSVSAGPVMLSVTRDNAAIETAINTFVSTFNTLAGSITDKTKYDQESNTRGALLGDSTTLNIRQRLYTTVQAKAVGVTGSFSTLADIGISVGKGGDLVFNRDKFRAAMEQDFQGVADLVAARVQAPAGTTTVSPGITSNDPNAAPVFTSLGLGSLMENVADSFINSTTGTLTRKSKTLGAQIDLQTKRIADFDVRLENKRTILQAQFLAMEQAIGRLQQQSQSLGSIR